MNLTTTNTLGSTRRSHNRGFTLIEVIVTMVILGILAAIAFPTFRGFTRSSQVTSATNDLVSAFNYARNEAVNRSLPVTVCKSADPLAAAPDCTNANNWEQGWIVFVDRNANGDVDIAVPADPDNDDIVLRSWGPVAGNVTMAGGAQVVNALTYAPTGFLMALLGASDAAAQTITVTSDANQLRILFSSNGRVRTAR